MPIRRQRARLLCKTPHSLSFLHDALKQRRKKVAAITHLWILHVLASNCTSPGWLQCHKAIAPAQGGYSVTKQLHQPRVAARPRQQFYRVTKQLHQPGVAARPRQRFYSATKQLHQPRVATGLQSLPLQQPSHITSADPACCSNPG